MTGHVTYSATVRATEPMMELFVDKYPDEAGIVKAALASSFLALIIGVVVLSWFDVGNRAAVTPERLPPALSGPEHAPGVLDNLRLWTGIALALALLTYILPLASIVSGSGWFGPSDGVSAMIEAARLLVRTLPLGVMA